MSLFKNILSIFLVYMLAVTPLAHAKTDKLDPYQLAKVAAKHRVQSINILQDHPLTAEAYNTSFKILKDSKNEVKIKLARATVEHINKFSISELYKPQPHPFKMAKAKFPLETIIFYGSIFAASVLQGAFSADPMDPAAFDTLKETLSDPIGYLGFFSFIMMSTATHATGSAMIPYYAKLSQDYVRQLETDIKNVKGTAGASTNANTRQTSLQRFDQSAKNINSPSGKFRFANTMGRATLMSMGPLAMSLGMFTSTQVEQLFHDEKINACAASWMASIKERVQGFAESEASGEGICQKAFASWFTKEKLERMWPQMVGMVMSSTLAHMIVGGALGALKRGASTNKVTEVIFQGIELVAKNEHGAFFQKLDKIHGLKWLAPFRFTWGGLVFQAANLTLFMTIEEAFMSEWFTIPVTNWVTKNQLKDQGQDLAQNLKRLRLNSWQDSKKTKIDCAGKVCAEKLVNTLFSEELEVLSDTLFSYRQNLLTKSMIANQNWLKFIQNFIATYQGSHRVYSKFLFEVEDKTTPNAFLVEDHLANVNVQIPGLPVSLPVPTINDPVNGGQTYDQHMSDVRGDLSKNGIDEHLREERFKTIVRAISQIDHWLVKQKEAIDRDALLVIKNYFRFADKTKDIESLFKDQIKFNEERLGKSKGKEKEYLTKEIEAYNKALAEYKLTSDRQIWEFNSRGSQVSRGLLIMEYHIKKLQHQLNVESEGELPENNVYVLLKKLVGGFAKVSAPGAQVLIELAQDKDTFDPETQGLHPKSIQRAKTPSMVQYLAISMACGPEVRYKGPLRLRYDMSLGDVMDEVKESTNLVLRNAGDKAFFIPPRIVSTNTNATICEKDYGKPLDLLTDDIKVEDKQGKTRYVKGLFNYLRESIDPKLLGKTEKDTNFNIWWDENIGSMTHDLFIYLRGHYQNLLDKHFYTVISNDEVTSNGLGDMPLANGVAESILQESQIYLAMMYLNYKDSRFFDTVADLNNTLSVLGQKDLFEKEWASHLNVKLNKNKPQLSQERLEQEKAFFSEVQGRFEKSRDYIREFQSQRTIEEVRAVLDEFKKNQKDLEDQLVKYAAHHFGQGFSAESYTLPKTSKGDPRYYLEIGLRKLFDLHKEMNTYGRMAGLMAISFYDLVK